MILQEMVSLQWRLNRKSMHLQNRMEEAIRKSWEPYEDYGVYESMNFIRGTVNTRPEINQVLLIRRSVGARLREGHYADP